MYARTSQCSLHQRGIYLIWVFVMVPVLLGFLAFSIDMGIFLNERGKAQTAADAAALAGVYTVRQLFDADELIGDPLGTTAQAADSDAALRAAAENGFAHNPPDVTVQVTYPVPDSANPPSPYPLANEKLGGAQYGTAAYVLVAITQTSSSVFAPFLNIDEGVIGATAMGRYKEQKPRSCPGIFIYPDTPRRPSQLDLKQASSLNISSGGIYIDSDHNNALAGSAGSTVTADWIQSSGGTGNAQIDYICRDNPTPCPELYKDLDATFTIPAVTIPVTADFPACPSGGASTPPACGTIDTATGNPVCPCTLSAPCAPLATGGCRVFQNTPEVGPDDLPVGADRNTTYCTLTAGKYCGGLTIRNDNSGQPFKVKLQPYISGGGVADEARDTYFYMVNGQLIVRKTLVVADDGGVTGQGITIHAPDEGSGSTYSVDLDYSTLTSWANDDCDADVPVAPPDGSLRIYAGRLGLAHGSCLNLHSYDTENCGAPLEIYTGLVP